MSQDSGFGDTLGGIVSRCHIRCIDYRHMNNSLSIINQLCSLFKLRSLFIVNCGYVNTQPFQKKMQICPCCIPKIALVLLFLALIIVVLSQKLLFSSSVKGYKIFLKYCSYALSLCIALLAIYISILNQNEDLKQRSFAGLFGLISKSPKLDPIRCNLLRNATGRTLEIGPGPATNFRCLKGSKDVTHWTGIEPNKYFQDVIMKEKQAKNISFEVETKWLNGEHFDVEESSMDTVIGTHVLCSVENVDLVLRNVARSLKVGGIFYFFEHTKADQNSYLFWFQNMLSSIIYYLGAGCQFKETWKNVEALSSIGFVVDYKNISVAEIGFPLFFPHIIGTAKKISNSDAEKRKA